MAFNIGRFGSARADGWSAAKSGGRSFRNCSVTLARSISVVTGT
jgi:hypothetical protein